MHRDLISLAVAFASLTLVAPARADFVYALSNNTGKVIRYQTSDPAGTVTEVRAATGMAAAGLALGPDGNLYVGDWGNFDAIAPSISRIELSNNNAASTVYSFGATGWYPGSLAFRNTTDLLVGRTPYPLFAPGPVVRVANAIGGTATASDYTTGSSLMGSPGLAVAANGTLYVSDQTYNSTTGDASGPVKQFNASGAYVKEVIANGSQGLAGPTGLAIVGNTLFTASIMNGQVLRTNLLDDTTTTFSTALAALQTSPASLAALSDGGLVAGSAAGSGLIYRFNAAGELVGTPFNSGLGTIGGLVVAPVPEPGSILTAAAGLAATLAWLRRRGARG